METLKQIIIEGRGFGRENEENMWLGREIDVAGHSPISTLVLHFLKLLFTLKHSECKFWWVSPGSILSKNNIIVTKVLADIKCSDLIIN